MLPLARLLGWTSVRRAVLGIAVLHAAAAPSLAVSYHSSAIDLSPDGLEVWVVNPDHASVSVIGTQAPQANTLLAEIPVGREPWCVDTHPTNGEAWVTSLRDDRVYIVDMASRTVVDSIDTGYETFGVAFDPSGTVALVTASGADRVLAVDVASRAIVQSFAVYRRPRGIAWRADGARAWVSHLLMPEFFGRLTVVYRSTWTTAAVLIQQVFGTNLAGYPSAMQNITLAPAPGDSLLWIPSNLINTATGGLVGRPFTPTNIFHAAIRPVNVSTNTDLNLKTVFMSEGGRTPVGGPIAVDFKSGRAYVANLHSENVTVLDDDALSPVEIAVIGVGAGPIGIVTHPTLARAYVANWLGRSVSVIRTDLNQVVATVATVTSEPLPPAVLHGKQLFFSSKGPLSYQDRGSCASCHVFGRNDGRPWDLSQLGKHLRATPDMRGIGYTGPHEGTADMDEMQDHEWGIRNFAGGAGLIAGTPNPALGPPNRGLSVDLDDLSLFMSIPVHRPDTPFLAPGGGLTAEADSGSVLFHDPTVGCATCHVPPFYTDSSLLQTPYLKHDVGTTDPADPDAAAGFDTPSLVGIWDTGPYLHDHRAQTLQQVMTTFNPTDQHGTTSHLSAPQIDFLAAFLRSIGWPDSTGTPVAAPAVAATPAGDAARAYPNPFRAGTSLRFALDRNHALVEIEILDVAGRHVRSLLARPMTRGTHIVGWDARDDRGRAVAPGTYFGRIAPAGAESERTKMTVLR